YAAGMRVVLVFAAIVIAPSPVSADEADAPSPGFGKPKPGEIFVDAITRQDAAALEQLAVRGLVTNVWFPDEKCNAEFGRDKKVRDQRWAALTACLCALDVKWDVMREVLYDGPFSL